MPARLVALDDGPDIPLDRTMVVVGRHPQCDARLDSLRVSRHHCCMTRDKEEILVRDLGSTNGIRINGQRAEVGRLRPGDELMIAHYRYRLEDSSGQDMTLLDSTGRTFTPSQAFPNDGSGSSHNPGPQRLDTPRFSEDPLRPRTEPGTPPPLDLAPIAAGELGESRLAAMVRELLPADVAEHCKIQVIVQMPGNPPPAPHTPHTPIAEERVPCQPDSSQ